MADVSAGSDYFKHAVEESRRNHESAEKREKGEGIMNSIRAGIQNLKLKLNPKKTTSTQEKPAEERQALSQFEIGANLISMASRLIEGLKGTEQAGEIAGQTIQSVKIEDLEIKIHGDNEVTLYKKGQKMLEIHKTSSVATVVFRDHEGNDLFSVHGTSVRGGDNLGGIAFKHPMQEKAGYRDEQAMIEMITKFLETTLPVTEKLERAIEAKKIEMQQIVNQNIRDRIGQTLQQIATGEKPKEAFDIGLV